MFSLFAKETRQGKTSSCIVFFTKQYCVPDYNLCPVLLLHAASSLPAA
eukprot:COSAG01_NODE_18122_length_1099_cov_1.506000_2_plen_47_part_01